MKLRDQTWLAIAAPIAVGILVLGCVISLYVQTWMPLLLSTILIGTLLACAAVTLLITDRVWRTVQPWECPTPRCRYDRRGLSPHDPCPECGRWATADGLPPPPRAEAPASRQGEPEFTPGPRR